MCSNTTVFFGYFTYVLQITDLDDITFEFTDIQEGPAKRRRIIYSIVITAAVVADAFYLIMTFNNNPFENVAIFHETKVMAHRGLQKRHLRIRWQHSRKL